jgi:hypothetical protein
VEIPIDAGRSVRRDAGRRSSRKAEWVVYAKRPFGGPGGSAGLSVALHPPRCHRKQSLDHCDQQQGVTFKWKDYRVEGRDRYKQMTLAADEFIRRFVIHVLPKGFHRIRHYGLFAKSACAENIAYARQLFAVSNSQGEPTDGTVDHSKSTCPCCGGRMIVIEVFERGTTPRHRPTAPTNRIRIDTS